MSGRGPFNVCGSCETPIVWLRTEKGGSMPCLRVQKDGEPVNPNHTFDRLIHTSHFSDCKDASKFRRPRRPAHKPTIAPTILGITLWQPWVHAVSHLGCRLINATEFCGYPPGVWLAIHAGQRYDEGGAAWIRKHVGVEPPPDGACHKGAICAVARYAGLLDADDADPLGDPWHAGEIAWGLSDITPIQPVHCAGAPKLWPLPADVLAQVRAAWRVAYRERYHAQTTDDRRST